MTNFFVFLFFCFSFSLQGGEIYFELSNEDMGALGGVSKALRGSSSRPDGNYTQGAYLSYSHKDLLPNSLFSFFILQDLFSPSDKIKERPFATEGSRAFASYAGGGARFVFRHHFLFQSLLLMVGVLGPNSGGAQIQNFFHETFRKKKAYSGWRDQIKGGAFFISQYNLSLRKSFFCDYLCTELSSSAGVSLGNLSTRMSLGGGLRLGTKLEEDYTTNHHSFLSQGISPSSSKGFSWNLLIRFFFIDVFHNHLLHGKTLLSQLKPVSPLSITGESHLGALLRFKKIALHLLFVFRSKEHETHEPYEFIRFGMGYQI